MDLPVVILEQIFHNLRVTDLLKASQVCKSWKHATDRLIAHRGKLHIKHGMVETISRNYQACSMRIPFIRTNKQDGTRRRNMEDELKNLQLVLDAVVRNCKPRWLGMIDSSGFHAVMVFQAYGNWIENIESLEIVSVDCYFTADECNDIWVQQDDSERTLEFPNLKHLKWTWRSSDFYENTPLNIVAPNLETVKLNLELIGVKMFHCKNLQQIEYRSPQPIPMRDIFVENLSNLTSLKVWVSSFDYDLSVLSEMPFLRWLEVGNIGGDTLNQVLECFYMCNELLELKFFGNESTVADNPLDLTTLLDALQNLQQLELGMFLLQMSDLVEAKNLLKLVLRKDVELEPDDSLSISAPNLKTLLLPSDILDRVTIRDNHHLTQLHVYAEDYGGLKRLFESDLKSFLLIHTSVKDLTMEYTKPPDTLITIDQTIYGNIQLNVERLELRNLSIAANFFQLLNKWKHLKHLSLDDCTINCRGLSGRIYMPRIKKLDVFCCGTVGRRESRPKFPLKAGRSEVVFRVDHFVSKHLIPIFKP